MHLLLKCRRMASETAVLEKHMRKIVVGFQDRCD